MNNEPAFPCEWDYIGSSRAAANGMTLRDYFAAKAMQSFLSWPTRQYCPNEVVAHDSYELADAMMEARK